MQLMSYDGVSSEAGDEKLSPTAADCRLCALLSKLAIAVPVTLR